MVSPPVREPYNAKARHSTTGSRKKRGKRKTREEPTAEGNPNAEILPPKSKDEKKKKELLQELNIQSDSKWTSKKKRRLENYIEKKLKNEERVLLFEKLTQTQASMSSSLLHSSASLGTGRLSGPTKSSQNTEGFIKTTSLGKKRKRPQNAFVIEEGVDDDVTDSSDSACDSLSNQSMDETKGHDGDHGQNDEACERRLNVSDSEEVVDNLELPAKKKSLGFKHWALEQLNTARAVSAHAQTSSEDTSQPPNPKRQREPDSSNQDMFRGPLGDTLELPATEFARQMMSEARRTSVVQIKRPLDVEETRILLPIVAEQQSIMESIMLNPVVIICGETGSGKTTQVPQFLYEAGFGTPGTDNPGMIGITQPRRVAAVSMASRVAHELSLTSSHVSYQIRYDTTVSPSTSIKFMTDGVLLRELATDFLLTKYSVIIIDEAHERSINTDILIGVLSRVIKLREEMWKQKKDCMKPLRMIIMSATLRVSDFAENKTLFASPPPVINVEARQHPVTIHFSRRTHADYITQAIKKITKIHTQLPPGGILVFLTGRNEIEGVCKRLEADFGHKTVAEKLQKRGLYTRNGVDVGVEDTLPNLESVVASQAPFEVEDVELGSFDGIESESDNFYEKTQRLHLDGDEDEDQEQDFIVDDSINTPMHIVPLYSLLPSERQMRAFQPPPPHSRLVVVATNIAETSLTIPGIRYVVDCGRAKERHYDDANGIQAFRISWISKASAAQRAGRAGRTAPGHCYRLYSSAVFEHHFDGFSEPEILKIPIEGVVLQMKSMHIDAVVNFPFPTPPDRQALYKAERTLTYLGALTPLVSPGSGGQVTELGRAMALFPLSPRSSRMLITAQQCDCLPYIICIVSALSVGDPFVHLDALEDVSDGEESLSDLKNQESRQKEARRSRRKTYHQSLHTHASLGKHTSDLFRILSVIGAYEYSGRSETFCSENFVRPKAMDEIHKLMMQITNIVLTNFPGIELNFKTLPPPNDRQLKAIRQIVTAGFLDQVAIRGDLLEKQGSGTQYATSKGIPYRALGVTEDAYLHPSSILVNSRPPDYLVFSDIVRTSRLFLKGLTVINPNWLSALGKDTLCSFSKPVKNDFGVMMTIPKFGPDGWELPAISANVVS